VGKLFFSDRDLQQIRYANLDGSGVTTLYGPTGLVLPHGVVLDVANGMIYCADADGQRIVRGKLDGSTPLEAIVSSGLGNPWDIDIAITAVPEPSTLWLLGSGAGLLFLTYRSRRNTSKPQTAANTKAVKSVCIGRIDT